MKYGVRHFDGKHEVRLVQISGGGRIRVRDGALIYWCGSRSHTWEAYEADDDSGQLYDDEETAAQVARNISMIDPANA